VVEEFRVSYTNINARDGFARRPIGRAYICYSHNEEDIVTTLEAAQQAFTLVRRRLDEGNLGRYIRGGRT
jgi:hypothetical protein